MPASTTYFWKSYSSPHRDELLRIMSLQSESEICAGFENYLVSFK